VITSVNNALNKPVMKRLFGQLKRKLNAFKPSFNDSDSPKFVRSKALLANLGVKFVTLKQGFFALSLSQKLYLVAFILLLTQGEKLVWVALISVIAMGFEFWPMFERLWHSLAGKAVLLLFYAIIANFALATSAAVVNEVVGVSASHLDYTHNFAILLYLPAWFVVMSGLVLLAMQLIIPLYFIISVLLKPLGIATIRFTEHSKFRKTTAILRLILASIVLYHLGLLVDVEEAVVVSEETLVSMVNVDGKSDYVAEEELEEEIVLVPEERLRTNVLTQDQQEKNYDELRQHYQQRVREMIAIFAFSLEADSRSRCQKAKDSSVIELNDYEILEITKDPEAKYGYQFEVKKCVSVAFPLR
jgi:hypothetical protein